LWCDDVLVGVRWQVTTAVAAMSGYTEDVPLDLQCWHHGIEPVPESYYRLCIECGHCYVTRDDLETLDYAKQLSFERYWADFTAVALLARDIHICPLCTHDF
jgi:hypothetical protein